MTDSNTKKLSYYNTLIFTIISGIVSLILLATLFTEIGKDYLLAIIILEIGIFSIIAWCIYKIMRNEYIMNRLKKSANVVLSYNSCPDYFSLKNNTPASLINSESSSNPSNDYCSNEYIYTDTNNAQYLIKLYPDNPNNSAKIPSPPGFHTPLFPSTAASSALGTTDKFYINEIPSKSNLLTNEQKCAPIFNESTATNPPVTGYSYLPWTNMKAQCQGYNN